MTSRSPPPRIPIAAIKTPLCTTWSHFRPQQHKNSNNKSLKSPFHLKQPSHSPSTITATHPSSEISPTNHNHKLSFSVYLLHIMNDRGEGVWFWSASSKGKSLRENILRKMTFKLFIVFFFWKEIEIERVLLMCCFCLLF